MKVLTLAIIGVNKMNENFEQMAQRHKREIYELQKNCKHIEISDWMDYMWAPGHFGSPVKVCKFCGVIVESKYKILD